MLENPWKYEVEIDEPSKSIVDLFQVTLVFGSLVSATVPDGSLALPCLPQSPSWSATASPKRSFTRRGLSKKTKKPEEKKIKRTNLSYGVTTAAPPENPGKIIYCRQESVNCAAYPNSAMFRQVLSPPRRK